ncbi:MAG: oxygen-dependent coproporphyrinogen oxidase [Oligoflexales bacterium]
MKGLNKMLNEEQKQRAEKFFQDLQDRLMARLEEVDGSSKAERKSWERPGGGGGRMSVLRGEVVEKAGVNFSSVQGDEYPSIEEQYKGKPFTAMGTSTVTHMMNPYAPIGHMNVRMLQVGDDFWFGGGGDLTPCIEFEEDTKSFHAALKKACDQYRPEAYDEYSKWCKEYFYIKHWKSERGVGGVFFDYVKGDFEEVFAFVQNVANAYVQVFPDILLKRRDTSYTEEEKEKQLRWRGRYAEFNLAYDRGTRFGLMTGGNPEAIFVSLPPVVKW